MHAGTRWSDVRVSWHPGVGLVWPGSHCYHAAVPDDPHFGPHRGRGLGPSLGAEPGPGHGPGDTLYEQHEPTEKVERPNITLQGVSRDVAEMLPPRPRSAAAQATSEAPQGPAGQPSHRLVGAPARPTGPVFVSMKTPKGPSEDRTDIVPAIERPDMRPRLRPVSEPPAWMAPPAALGHYAPRARPSRRWLLLYLVLIAGAALAGAGVTLWLRSLW